MSRLCTFHWTGFANSSSKSFGSSTASWRTYHCWSTSPKQRCFAIAKQRSSVSRRNRTFLTSSNGDLGRLSGAHAKPNIRFAPFTSWDVSRSHILRRVLLVPRCYQQTTSTDSPPYAVRKFVTTSFHCCGKAQNGDQDGSRTERVLRPMRTQKAKEIDRVTVDKPVLIEAFRACSDYCLTPQELSVLPKKVRRSAYQTDPKEVKYFRSDIIDLAVKKYGSLQAMERHRQDFHSRQEARRLQNLFGLGILAPPTLQKQVLAAGSIGRIPDDDSLGGCYATGSSCLFAEGIHSLADTVNQVILYWGIKESLKQPDSEHPYGYSNLRYVASLMSGAGIFWFGTGLSVYHGFTALLFPQSLEPLLWGFAALLFSLLSEGVTLILAYKELSKKSVSSGVSLWEYIKRGSEPSLNVVLLEDIAAVLGVACAGSFLAVAHFCQSSIPDAIGSFAIGGILATLSMLIIKTNVDHLVGRSIPDHRRNSIINALEQDPMIRSVSDVKATEMGNKKVRFKAEIEFDGKNLTRAYLDDLDLEKVLQEFKTLRSTDELKSVMANHGDLIIDRLATEIDRIEKELKAQHPELRHVDLEAL